MLSMNAGIVTGNRMNIAVLTRIEVVIRRIKVGMICSGHLGSALEFDSGNRSRNGLFQVR